LWEPNPETEAERLTQVTDIRRDSIDASGRNGPENIVGATSVNRRVERVRQ
jgi:hypothetical protein